jgi:hypothetical protein
VAEHGHDQSESHEQRRHGDDVGGLRLEARERHPAALDSRAWYRLRQPWQQKRAVADMPSNGVAQTTQMGRPVAGLTRGRTGGA